MRAVLAAFLRRAAFESTRELTPLALQLASIGMGLLSQAYLGKLVDSAPNPQLGSYSGHFAGYLLLGIALLDLQLATVGGLAKQIRNAQHLGWLETMLVTPAPTWLLMLGLALPDVLGSLLRMVIYAAAGALIFGLDLGAVNLAGVAVTLLGALAAFGAFALLGAALAMMLRRSDPLQLFLSAAALIAGGVFYPRGVLPAWLQAAGAWVPIAPALDALRAAVVHGRGPSELGEPLLRLGVIVAVVGLLGTLVLRRALARARDEGSLTAA
jgi:ABC-2 type transport system permease protein